jgi:hypothetical protein
VGGVPKNCGEPQDEVRGSKTLRRAEEQSQVWPPKRYTLPSAASAPAASAVAAGTERKVVHVTVEELDIGTVRSREKKSVEREVSDNIPPRMYAVALEYTVV